MKRVGIVLHAARAEAVRTASRLSAALAGLGVEVTALPDDASRIEGSVTAADALGGDLDLVIAFGGDGTLLRAVSLVRDASVPVLGVNLGHLGFLTGMEEGDLEQAAAALVGDGVSIEERRLVTAHVRAPDGAEFAADALNDIIIEKERVGRSIRLSISIGGEPVVAWAADGMIVATSTGSTAYSFSAGGPVVSPRLPCLVVTPVAPHGMFGRTLIAPPDEEVVLDLAADSDPAALSPDGGPTMALPPGATVSVRLSERVARLAHLEPVPFWRLLREKFHLRPEGH